MYDPNNHTVSLPVELFEASGTVGHPVNISVGDGVIVILREKLTAIEAIKVFEYLANLGDSIFNSVLKRCGKCLDCEDGCSYDGESRGFIDIPPSMRKLYGIPESDKIRATLDEENERVILTKDGPTPDLRDVPEIIYNLVRCYGVCLTDLDTLIQSQIPVYDGEDCSDDEEEDNEDE